MKYARAHQLEHVPVVVLAAVAADVHLAQFVVEHVDALAEEVVHRAVEQFLVAGDGRGAEHDRVAFAQVSWRWSPRLMRTMALVGSPWLPVAMITTSCAGSDSISPAVSRSSCLMSR